MLKHIYSTALTDTAVWDKEGIGRIRYEDDGSVYRWVWNKEAAATDFTIGQVAFHKISDGADMLKYVYIGLTANLSVMGGVVLASTLYGGATYASNSNTTNTYKGFGWLQVHGYSASVSMSGATTGGIAVAAGDYLKGVDSAKHVVRDAATQPLYKKTIQTLEAIGTTTTPAAGFKKAFVTCL